MIELRPYQREAIQSIRNAIIDGKNKILLHLATGSGKTQIAKEIIEKSLANGKKVLFITKGRLVVQNGAKAIEGSSVIMNGFEKYFRKNNPIQVASIDTVMSRKSNLEFLKEFNIIIYDEAHYCVANSYIEFMDWVNVENKIHIGLTATPYKIGTKFHTFWDSYISPISVEKLIKKGYLNKYSLYVPNNIDTSDIKLTAGEYNLKQLGFKVQERGLSGNVVETYKKIAKDKVGIYFAVNVKHAEELHTEFMRSGVESVVILAKTSREKRDNYIQDLKDHFLLKKGFIIVSVGVMIVGIDIPEVQVCGIVRPTYSETLHIQMIGRALRVTPGVDEDVLLIDHAGNCLNHGLPCIKRDPDLIATRQKKTVDIAIKSCDECFIVFPPQTKKCPNCGYLISITQRDTNVDTDDRELILYKQKNNKILLEAEHAKAMGFYNNNLRGKVSEEIYTLKLLKRLYRKYGDEMLHLSTKKFYIYLKQEKLSNTIKEY